jgi:hypothetical protein
MAVGGVKPAIAGSDASLLDVLKGWALKGWAPGAWLGDLSSAGLSITNMDRLEYDPAGDLIEPIGDRDDCREN